MTHWLRNFSFRKRLLGLAVFNIVAMLLCEPRAPTVRGNSPTSARTSA